MGSSSSPVPSVPLPKYVCYKEVEAFKIGEIEPFEGYSVLKSNNLEALVGVTDEWIKKHNPEVGGYFVKYKDGYISYSPAQAFEEGYKLKE